MIKNYILSEFDFSGKTKEDKLMEKLILSSKKSVRKKMIDIRTYYQEKSLTNKLYIIIRGLLIK